MSSKPTLRLNKFLASRTGVSRREADTLIEEGRITINGHKIQKPPAFVAPGDEVFFNGKKIIYKMEPLVYIMLNKPQGYITAVKSESGFKTVMELVKKNTSSYRHIFPVGRLDFMSEGLLLLTNDGDFTYKVTHPKFNVIKSYIVEIKGILTDELLKKIKKGINLRETGLIKPQNVRTVSKKQGRFVLSIDLNHGKNREIRRLLEFFNLKIIMLKRVSIGKLYIGDLSSGHSRIINKNVAELVFK